MCFFSGKYEGEMVVGQNPMSGCLLILSLSLKISARIVGRFTLWRKGNLGGSYGKCAIHKSTPNGVGGIYSLLLRCKVGFPGAQLINKLFFFSLTLVEGPALVTTYE